MGDGLSRLDGEVCCVPFTGSNPVEAVTRHFERLVEEHGVDRVLVLKRFPTGIDTFTDELAHRTHAVERPTVDALTSHATTVVRAQEAPPHILADTAGNELARRFVRDREWETDYLDAAQKQESFVSDVTRLLNVIAWWGMDIETDDPVLSEIATASDEFYSLLHEHGYLHRGEAVSRGAKLLASDSKVHSRATGRFDAVLVSEYEEFGPIERRYLRQLTPAVPLVCIAEANSSVQRVWNEPGDIERLSQGMTVFEQGREELNTYQDSVAHFLATGSLTKTSDKRVYSARNGDEELGGDVQVIDEATFEQQVRTVADEIQRLRDEHGWAYDEFAVGFKFSRGPIAETIRLLRGAGIPTTSATVSGFGDDPAIRELLALSRHLATEDETEHRRLEARVADLDEPTLSSVREEPTLELALRRWALETNLKERIAGPESALEARAQFGHVRDVFELAEFVDESPLLEDDWASMAEALEGAFGTAAAETTTGATNVKGDGVLVDAVRVMKNASWKAVFMLNVVEGEYPARPGLSRLFPDSTLADLPRFPALTAPTAHEVRETFPTAPETITRPYHRYYEELARRLLAVGSRAATDRLYYGIYEEEDATTGKRTQPSRFLTAAYEEFPWIGTLDHEDVHGQSGATRFALSRTEQALREVKRAKHTGREVDLGEIERDFAAIQDLLDEDIEYAERLARAVRARVDFATGRVRNE